MADATETESLLRQIQYLTDLINNAKQKEKRTQQHQGSTSWFPHRLTKSGHGISRQKAQNSVTGTSSEAHPSSSRATESKSLPQRKSMSHPAHHQTGIARQDSTGTSSKQFVKHMVAVKNEKWGPSAIKYKLKETRPTVGQLSNKKAEVSLARETMKTKIEDLKASIAQLSAAKKERNAKSLKSNEKMVKQVKRTVSQAASQMGQYKVDTTNEDTQNREVKLADCESSTHTEKYSLQKTTESPSSLSQNSSSPHTTKNQLIPTKAVQTGGVGMKDRPGVMVSAVQLQTGQDSHSQSNSLDEDSSTETGQWHDELKEKKVTNAKKSDAVASLQQELMKTEKKLQHMRQKIGCMLRESPSKTTPSSTSSTQELASATGAHSTSSAFSMSLSVRKRQSRKHTPTIQGNTCHSSSRGKGPFPNRKSLRWTPQKQCLTPSREVLVVGTSPSLRSFRKQSPRMNVIKTNSAAANPSAWLSNLGECQKKQSEVCSSSAGKASVLSSSTPKVQTTRCVFGKYSLRNVKTGMSPAVKSPPAVNPVRSRFKVIRNPAQVATYKNHTEPRSVAQRAAKTVISKYKMQRVPVSALTSRLQSPYQKMKPVHTRHQFPAATFIRLGSGQYTQQAPHRFSATWRRDGLYNSHTAAYMRKKKAVALKARSSWSQMHSYRHYRHSSTSSGRQEQLQRRLKLIKKYKLTKWGSVKNPQPASSSLSGRGHQGHLLMINDARRKRMHTVSVRGVRFRVDSQGTKLQRLECANKKQDKMAVSRIDVGGTTFIQNKAGTLIKILDNQTKYIINRVKQRSIAQVAAKFKKDNTKGKKKLCLFYSRFGKCSRGEKCPYTHDPDKIAVCTRFLRGTCKVEHCPFSHKVAKEKMPVCAFFLRGVCAREDCPYLHVKVDSGAEICQDFVNGFCSLADKCKKLHTLTCPAFSKTGSCPDGKKCRLQHKRETASKAKNTRQVDLGTSAERMSKNQKHSVKRKLVQETHREDTGLGEDEELPQKLVCLPAFISLADYSTDESPAQTPLQPARGKTKPSHKGSSLQIKPRI